MPAEDQEYDRVDEVCLDSSLLTDPNVVPVKSVEGWIILVKGIHEEAQEEDVRDVFENYGNIRNIHLNLDRRTGYVKGYAFIEYRLQDHAIEAIKQMDGKQLLGKDIQVGWAFVKSNEIVTD